MGQMNMNASGKDEAERSLQRLETIEVDRIYAPDYQRPVNPRRVARILMKFNEAKLGVLVVSQHGDGRFACLDGQHRLCAVRSLGYKSVRCIVLENLTEKEEADYFRFQGENSASLSTLDKYNAGVYAQDPHYVAISQMLRQYGYKVGKTCGPRCIAAVGALSEIATMFGFGVLEQTLATINETWPYDTVILRREMLAGMAEFVGRFGNAVSPKEFASRMSRYHPSELLYESQERLHGRGTTRGAFSRNSRFIYGGVLADWYNKGLNGMSKKRVVMRWEDNIAE